MPHNQSRLLHARILIVDTDETHTFILSRMLEWAGYANVKVCQNPPDALVLYDRFDPDVVLVDLHMPGVGKPSLLAQLRERATSSFLPVLAFAMVVDREARHIAVANGASDILPKFGDSDEVLARLANFAQIRNLNRQLRQENLTLEETVRLRTASLERAQQDLADRMAHAAEYRKDESGRCATRVGDLASEIARELGRDPEEIEVLRMAAGLHDVGNVAVPDAVLLKPSDLSEAERELIHVHTDVGAQLLAKGHSALLRMAAVIARTHHERWDGTGYPSQLKREEIPLPGRIVAVADVFDALTHDRPYRRAVSRMEAVLEIEKNAGSQFDPTVVQAFRRALSEHQWAA